MHDVEQIEQKSERETKDFLKKERELWSLIMGQPHTRQR
jgi:hypothetical protein